MNVLEYYSRTLEQGTLTETAAEADEKDLRGLRMKESLSKAAQMMKMGN